MIGISVAELNEWENTLKYFNKTHDECQNFHLENILKHQ